MKVLLIVNNVFYQKEDGLYTFRAIGEFANELVSNGHQVEMFQTRIKSNDKFHDFNLTGYPIQITALRRFRFKLFTYVYVYLVGIYKVFKTDYLYIYYPTNYHFLAFFSLLVGKKYGLNIRGQHGIYSRLSKFLYKHAHVVFTVSPEFTKLVVNAGGHGITQKPGISFNSDDIYLDKIYNNKSHYKLLYLGRLVKDKGLVELLNAVHSLRQKGENNFTLDIVGDGSDEELLYQKCKMLNIHECVFFHGGVVDLVELKKFYLNADLFILPTYHEGFPRTLYEAMIFGLPIVTTFVGGISSVMINNFNCIEITPKSYESVEAAIRMALLNYPDMKRLALNAINTVSPIVDKDRLSHAGELSVMLNSIH